MTTIASDGKCMVSDGYITAGDTVVETNRRKVFKLKSGDLIGFAGNGYNWESVIEYFNRKDCDWPKIVGTQQILFLCKKSGKLFLYDQDGRSFERTGNVSIGSGWHFAIGAMDAGKSPEEAVQIACNRDVHSGGSIFVETLS